MDFTYSRKNYAVYVLTAFFMITLGIRLYLAFSTPYFSDDSSYFALRQIEEITMTGTPLYNDPLSYGGRHFVFPPLFQYILAFFNIFLPLVFAAKLLPNLFASLLVIIVYFLTKEITKNRVAALYTAGISGFIPIFFQKTINSVSPYSLVVPLIAYSIFCFIRLNDDKKYAYYLLFSISCLTLVHASALLLAIALIIYLIFLKIEDIKISNAEVEVVLFATLLVLWFLLLIYKKALLSEGMNIIWQNIPSQIIWKYFKNITVLEGITKIGIVPFVYGIVTIYRYLFRKKTKFTYLFISFALTVGLLLIIKSIEISVGLMFLGMILTVLYSMHFRQFRIFIKKTKFARLRPFLMISLSITFTLTQFVPSLVYAEKEISLSTSSIDVEAFEWISENTDLGSTVLSVVEDGHKITYFSRRKNVIDANFLNAGDTDKIFDDIKTIYTTQYKTEAIKLLNKYDIDYIYFSQGIKDEFRIDKLRYTDDENCFEPVYDSGEGKERIIIYKSMCRLEETTI